MKKLLIAGCLLALIGGSCGMQRKIGRLPGHSVSIAPDDGPALPAPDLHELVRDTLTVQDETGRQVLIMRAVRDVDGEMVATDVLPAARVTARFRNVAERAGKVDLRFEIRVPKEMQDSQWQLRFYPQMDLTGERIPLDPVFITGSAYRKAQLRGYQHYQRFLDSIIQDSTLFLSRRQLELFVRRNLPGLYRFRNDTTLVCEEEFASAYGVTQQEAVRHYTLQFKIWRNNRKIARKGYMFDRYVKVPIVTEGLRLDSVMTGDGQEFIYCYTQPIQVRPALRKADISLQGSIYEQEKRIYRIPESEPITFYISSLSTLVQPMERYVSHIVERRAEAHTACYIDFEAGSAAVKPPLGENRAEIARIRANLLELVRSDTFDIDSIVVTASCSPEGEYRTNERLARERSGSVSSYFSHILRGLQDSIRQERGLVMDLENVLTPGQEIRFISRYRPEDWESLDRLVKRDSLLRPQDKAGYASLRQISDPDRREAALQQEPYYRHLREKLYPRLRTVRFSFQLHRRGMLKDTVMTTVPDTVYRNGLQAIRDRDYERAVTLLRPYGDYNTAVAYLCMDYNASAAEILDKLDPTPAVLYMQAILHARSGDDRAAVQAYLQACRLDPSYIHRGNLDPEISELARRYDIRPQGPEENLSF